MAEIVAPTLVMVAGPNGSGKSTLIERLRTTPDFHLPKNYINADDIQQAEGLTAPAAQQTATERRLAAINAGESVMYETVMSHPSRIAELQLASKKGYKITVFFVATDNPQLNVERVLDRVEQGGHDVPADRIIPRYQRALALAPTALQYATRAVIFDNSSLDGHDAQAELIDGHLELRTEKPSPWVAQLVAKFNERAVELENIERLEKSKGVSLCVPDLNADSVEGEITLVTSNYALQLDPDGKMYLHDRAFVREPLEPNHSYKIDYREGVATVTPSR